MPVGYGPVKSSLFGVPAERVADLARGSGAGQRVHNRRRGGGGVAGQVQRRRADDVRCRRRRAADRVGGGVRAGL
jgi:hypothetical protein